PRSRTGSGTWNISFAPPGPFCGFGVTGPSDAVLAPPGPPGETPPAPYVLRGQDWLGGVLIDDKAQNPTRDWGGDRHCRGRRLVHHDPSCERAAAGRRRRPLC